MIRLHARASRLAAECGALLRAGFPDGVAGRGRSPHETAAVAYIIRESEADVAERLRLREAVNRLRDARSYEQNREALGLEPFEDGFLGQLASRVDELVERFGKEFREEHGWAAELFEGRAPKFRRLEERAGLSHLRPYYQFASNDIHAGARAVDAAVIDFRGTDTLLAGPTNSGLAEPSHGALISLIQVTTALLGQVHEAVAETDLGRAVYAQVRMTVLRELLDEVGERFGAAQTGIDEAESLVGLNPENRTTWLSPDGAGGGIDR